MQKKKIKKDPTAKKRKQTNSSDEPDTKAAKTDGSDNSDSDNGRDHSLLGSSLVFSPDRNLFP